MQSTARIVAMLALATSAVPPAMSSDIYKCVADGVTAYQSMPCEHGQAQLRVSVVGADTDNAARYPVIAAMQAPTQVPVQRTLRPGPWGHQALALGMSDDEVLNMPAWGRPNRIERKRLARGWLEVWTYRSPTVGERELRFTNARLTDIGDAAPTQVALYSR